MNLPAFIITIDTEGDNLWENNRYITTNNAYFIPRFQTLCEKYSFKPVYLTNYEMATNNVFVNFARDMITSGNAEIGMHLHAWNSPPLYNLTSDDRRYKPFLIEYPEVVMYNKIIFMTELLEDIFQKKMLSHRAGRWAFNECYASMLLKLYYQVDCSVTPRVDWSNTSTIQYGVNGSNYRYFPNHAYFINPINIAQPGNSQLLEVPMTISDKYSPWINTVSQIYHHLCGNHRSLSVRWLRPAPGNIKQMCQLVKNYLAAGSDYVEFMIHSSELMPGGSPTFKDKISIERLFYDLEQLFEWLQDQVTGMTLAQYYQYFLKKREVLVR